MERGIIIHDNDGNDYVDFFAAKDGGYDDDGKGTCSIKVHYIVQTMESRIGGIRAATVG